MGTSGRFPGPIMGKKKNMNFWRWEINRPKLSSEHVRDTRHLWTLSMTDWEASPPPKGPWRNEAKQPRESHRELRQLLLQLDTKQTTFPALDNYGKAARDSASTTLFPFKLTENRKKVFTFPPFFQTLLGLEETKEAESSPISSLSACATLSNVVYDQEQNKTKKTYVPLRDRPVLMAGLASGSVRKCGVETSPIWPKISSLPGKGSRQLSRTAPHAVVGGCHYKTQIGHNYTLPEGNA